MFLLFIFSFVYHLRLTVSISLVIRDEYDRLQLQEGIFLPSELAERLLHQVQARDFPVSKLGKTAVVNRRIFGDFLLYLFNTSSSTTPLIPLCRRMLVSNPESVATLPPFGPIEGQKWFYQISSQ